MFACPPYLNADLHCHSTFSDGTLAPAELAARARQGGVDLWSLTDHDELAGQTAACQAAHAQGMDYLTGGDFGQLAGHTVHIVGLGFDCADGPLQQGLHALRHSRGPRAQEMGHQLALAGIPGAYEGALRYVGNPELISRTHFARFLVDAGICADVTEVFQRYLTEGKPGFVPQRWAGVAEAVRWITAARGVAVMAHPAATLWAARWSMRCWTNSRPAAARASEVTCGSHSAAEALRYAEWPANGACTPRAAATSTARQNPALPWGPCPHCPAG
jgi:predicted metal-dependent phosphoesterase TrpH